MTLSVVSGEEIAEKSLTDLDKIAFAVTDLYSVGKMTSFMHGIGNNKGDTRLTAAYLDEAPLHTGHLGEFALNANQLVDIPTLDLKRVEILKGPQGTLYGTGAVTGTVRFITQDPELTRFGGHEDVDSAMTEGGSPGYAANAYNSDMNGVLRSTTDFARRGCVCCGDEGHPLHAADQCRCSDGRWPKLRVFVRDLRAIRHWNRTWHGELYAPSVRADQSRLRGLR
jgi:TonB-dependent receptor-like protein